MKLIEWLGGVMMLVALIEFIPNPRRAIRSISEVLFTNVRMAGNHLVLHKVQRNSFDRIDTANYRP